MRRGTPAAKEFGLFLKNLRLYSGQSMRELGEKVGLPAGSVSQIEAAERALKEYRLDAWADALGVGRPYLKRVWMKTQKDNPDPPLIRGRSKSVSPLTLEKKIKGLESNERNQVLGYIDALLAIKAKEA